MFIRDLTTENRDEALALLRRHRESSMLLLGNLETHGPRLTEHLNSGNYRCLQSQDGTVAVFVLTRRGNLLVQTDRQADYAEAILAACEAELMPITGALGEWSIVERLWARYRERQSALRTSFRSREILFRLDVSLALLARDPRVRLLAEPDFEECDELRRAFCAEAGLPFQGTAEERRQVFLTQQQAGGWWGCFDEGRLVSIAGINARVDGLGQVGGVYTPPVHRRLGHSRAVMQAIILDSRELHGLSGLVLFTDEGNAPAQSLYRGLGFAEIGHFGIFFGHVDETLAS